MDSIARSSQPPRRPNAVPASAPLSTNRIVARTIRVAAESDRGASQPGVVKPCDGHPDARSFSGVATLQPGDQLPGFTLIKKLGHGGQSQVFFAEQDAIAGRKVVLKISTRPNTEAELLGRLQHPNLVPILSIHQAGPFEILCMPYLGQTTLADWLAAEQRHRPHALSTLLALVGNRPVADSRLNVANRLSQSQLRIAPLESGSNRTRRIDVSWVLGLLAKLASGLDHAHRRGILHLDIKPANVLIADHGEPMLLDFNLSHDIARRVRESFGGTMPYMAPEQVNELITRNPGKVDERTDLYGLGALAYELLTGEQPLPAPVGVADKLPWYLEQKQCSAPSPRAKNPAVSPAVDSIVRKLLAPQPADRYQTALELKNDIDRHLANQTLISASDRSPRERFAKWRARNPWLPMRCVMASVVGLACALAICLQRRDAEMQELAAMVQASSSRVPNPLVTSKITSDSTRDQASGRQLLTGFQISELHKARRHFAVRGTAARSRDAGIEQSRWHQALAPLLNGIGSLWKATGDLLLTIECHLSGVRFCPLPQTDGAYALRSGATTSVIELTVAPGNFPAGAAHRPVPGRGTGRNATT